MRKDILEKKLTRLKAKRDNMRSTALASNDAAEVRSINAAIEDINAEIEETQAELDAITAEEAERSATPAEPTTVIPAGAQHINGGVVGSFSPAGNENRSVDTDGTDTTEYRMAFKAYVQNGTPIPANLIPASVRSANGETINTADTGAAIPITVINDVINTVRKRYGNLYSKVRKLNVPGGVEFPIGALKATFKWITEETVSPRQRIGKLGRISFKYNTAEIRVAQSFLSSILTLSSFEARLAEVIAVAYLENMDIGIVKGTGEGQLLGILNDERIPAENVVEFTEAEISDWKAWRKKFFAKLPLGYRAGEFIFPLGTVDAYLETMSDNNGNPVFRQATGLEVNDGDATNPNGRFFGRDISLVEPDVIADFDTAEVGDVVGIFWQPDEYAINENFGFTMRRYFDDETNEWVDKALVVVDGKILNPTGYWLIKKKASA